MRVKKLRPAFGIAAHYVNARATGKPVGGLGLRTASRQSEGWAGFLSHLYGSAGMRDAIIDKTGGTVWCGPCVVAALTGQRLSLVERMFRRNGLNGVATTALDVANALSHFGLGLTLGYMADYGEEQPLWWVLRFFPDDAPLIIPITECGVVPDPSLALHRNHDAARRRMPLGD